MGLSEDQLCLAFAERAKVSDEFVSWILSHTKFHKYAGSAVLLHEEQMKHSAAQVLVEALVVPYS